MKKKYWIAALFIYFVASATYSQNWETFGGNSSRNGLSRIQGPVTANPALWQVQSSMNSSLGMAVYSFGDKFVNSRTTFSPYTSRVECRDLNNGNLLWVSPYISNTSILYAIGMNEDAVYAHDYNTDTVYALNTLDGSIKWRSSILSHTFGAYPGCVFACNGDPILNASQGSGNFTMRLDKNNGNLVWTNNNIIVIGPAVALAANSNTVYRITGGITTPVRLTAIDINNGQTKYSSAPVPGDPDQEDPLILGTDSSIYFWRDGGNLFAYRDNGSALVQKWMYVPSSSTTTPLLRNITLGQGKTMYLFENNQVKRLSTQTGAVLSTLTLNVNSCASISVGKDSTVYINNGAGIIYVYSADLQTLKWQKNIPSATYLNPPLCKDGTIILSQSGTTITGLRESQALAPVADFRSSGRNVIAGQPVDFYDQSSFQPNSWQWQFPGSNQGSASLQNPTGITYNSPGTYPVTLKVQNSLGSDSCTKTCYLEVFQTTDIKEKITNSFFVYPNPANNFISVAHLEINQNEIPLNILDAEGKTVLVSSINHSEEKIDISSLPPGIYILRLMRYGVPSIRLVKQ